MSRAGLRAWRVGPFSGQVRPAAVARVTLIALMGILLLGFGLTHGSLPIPTSAIGRALFSGEPRGGCALYRDGYPPATAADGHFKRRDAGHGGAAMQSITRNGPIRGLLV